MATIPIDKFQILAPPSIFANLGIFIANVAGDALDGAWFFNKFSGEADADAMVRTSYNWAPNASNKAIDREWQTAGIAPTFSADYATISNFSQLKTGLGDIPAGGGCCFVLCKTDEASLGSPSTARANICGAFAGNLNRGIGIQFTTSSSGGFRATDYATSAPTTPVNCQGSSGAADLNKWRLLFASSGAAVKATDINPALGTTPNPNAVTLTGGRMAGVSNWCIGGFNPASNSSYTEALKKIAFCIRFNRLLTTPEYDAIVAQCNDIRSETGIAYGATTP